MSDEVGIPAGWRDVEGLLSVGLSPLCMDDWDRVRHTTVRFNGQTISDAYTHHGRLLFRVGHWYPE